MSAALRSAVEVVSFGCRLNLVEGETMRRVATAAGRENLAIVNTCGVTGEAVRQARQAIRRLRRDHPDRRIVVTGCAAEMDDTGFAAMDEIDEVVRNRIKTKRQAWSAAGPHDQPTFDEPTFDAPTFDAPAFDAALSPLAEGTDDHTRAFLAVQNGCDHACTFCAIPQGRGTSRSASIAEVVASARRLTARGFKEIVLTGVDLTSWGDELSGRPRLGQLVRAILAAVPELPRLRLSSLDCIEADPALIAAFAEEERLMPYLHLSLQSGDDLILKRMKRRHSRADAVAICAELRRLRPDMAFGADLIAGFPTETDDMAANSRSLIDACGLTFLHVFPFSPRPGTPAARMPKLAPGLAKERAERLRDLGGRALRRHLRAQIGRRLPILVERGGLGRAPDFTPVATGSLDPGALAPMRIDGHDARKLHGRHLDGP